MAHKLKTDPKTVAFGRLIELLAMTDPLGLRRLEGLSPAPDWVDLVEAIQEAPPTKLPVKIPRGNMTEAERRVFLLEKIETVQDMADRLHVDRSTIPRNCRRVAKMVAYMAVAGCTS